MQQELLQRARVLRQQKLQKQRAQLQVQQELLQRARVLRQQKLQKQRAQLQPMRAES